MEGGLQIRQKVKDDFAGHDGGGSISTPPNSTFKRLRTGGA